jgi:Flp pilus assembly pilin Flp
MSKIIAFLNDESGATAIEYGLIAATVNAIGTTLNGKFDSIATQLKEFLTSDNSVNGEGRV